MGARVRSGTNSAVSCHAAHVGKAPDTGQIAPAQRGRRSAKSSHGLNEVGTGSKSAVSVGLKRQQEPRENANDGKPLEAVCYPAEALARLEEPAGYSAQSTAEHVGEGAGRRIAEIQRDRRH